MSVSVLMNSYKEQEAYFHKAVRNALRAGCGQLILSTVKGDSCIQWAMEYPITVVVNSRPGIFSQLNAMLPHITEPYVCYASSNDYMLHNKLSLESAILRDSGMKVCYSSFLVYDKTTGMQRIARFDDYSYRENLQKSIGSDCAMVETEAFLRYTPFRVKYKNNCYRDLWLRIYEGEGDVFVYNDKPTWVYVVTKGSQHVRRAKDAELHKKNLSERAAMLKDHLPQARRLLGDDDPVVAQIAQGPLADTSAVRL